MHPFRELAQMTTQLSLRRTDTALIQYCSFRHPFYVKRTVNPHPFAPFWTIWAVLVSASVAVIEFQNFLIIFQIRNDIVEDFNCFSDFAHSVTLLFHRLIIKSKPSLDAVNISLDHDSVLYKMQSGSEQPIVYAKFVFIDRLPLIRPLWTLTSAFSMCASDPQNGQGFNSLFIPSPLSCDRE